MKVQKLLLQSKELQPMCLSGKVIVGWMAVLLIAMPVGAQNNFHVDEGVPHIQYLSISPTAISGGAMYVNSTDKKLYWYTGNEWVTASVAIVPAPTAPDGTAIVNITSPSGRIWMDRNMGAARAATSIDDYQAFGSLFQWCRAADGHQRVNWTSSTDYTPVNGNTSTLSTSTTAPNFLFITGSGDWVNPPLPNGSAWWNGTTAGVNNPCPNGYHVPTSTEWQAEINAGVQDINRAYGYLKLGGGYVLRDGGGLKWSSSHISYWSSSSGGSGWGYAFFINAASQMIMTFKRTDGRSVRCIKDL